MNDADNADEYKGLKLNNQLCFPLYVCAKEIINLYTPYLKAIGLTYTQYIVMMVLWEQKQVLTRHLRERLYLDSGTLTPVLNRLEQKNFITKNRSKDDARDLLVSITELGENLKKKAVKIQETLEVCVQKLEYAQELKHMLESMMEILKESKNNIQNNRLLRGIR